MAQALLMDHQKAGLSSLEQCLPVLTNLAITEEMQSLYKEPIAYEECNEFEPTQFQVRLNTE